MKLRFQESDKLALCRQVPAFTEIAEKTGLPETECIDSPFHALTQSIVHQQLAVRAAAAVFGRFEALLETVTPENLSRVDDDALRACGLSGRKIEYLRGITDAALSGTVDFNRLSEKTDEEVIAELSSLRGVGTWTAEMLLIFSLGRRDVLSFKDLGIRNGILQMNGWKTLSERRFEAFRKRCSPYGTLASLYLWRIKDGGLMTNSNKN